MEQLISLTPTQIARVFERWNADAAAGNWPADPDHERQAETFVEYAQHLLASEL